MPICSTRVEKTDRKFVYTKLSYPKSSLQNWSKPFSLPIPAKRIKLISIPTTHGTGSEVSSAGVLSNESFGKSVTLSHQYISDVVIHDPNLLIDFRQKKFEFYDFKIWYTLWTKNVARFSFEIIYRKCSFK